MNKYTGKGDKADLANHANQLNPEHPEYKGPGPAAAPKSAKGS